MRNTRRTLTALALVLAMAALPVTAAGTSAVEVQSASVEAVEVVGLGFWAAVGCAGCVAGAGAIIAGGAGAVLVAAASSNSFWVAAACVGLCVEAFN
jgi:hypothetical protein